VNLICEFTLFFGALVNSEFEQATGYFEINSAQATNQAVAFQPQNA
jgi:hypothetical protein